MLLDAASVERYLQARFGPESRLTGLSRLSDQRVRAAAPAGGAPRALKQYGYGQPVLIHFELAGQPRRAVLNTMAANPFGHEYRADRAAGMLLAYDSFNSLPQHVRALDVGLVTPAGLRSVGGDGEFFLLTAYVEGTPYAHDLQRLRDTGTLTPLDLARAEQLAATLAEIHATRGHDPAHYRRHLRDTIGSGEGLFGLADSYPPDTPGADAAWLEGVERAAVGWRWRLKAHSHRVAQIHGDYHPFNILFREGSDLTLLDRSRSAWGEPGDDVSCLAINYLFFSLQRSGTLAPPFAALWERFWERYLDLTGDEEILTVVAPFFVWRALVLGSPTWYTIAPEVRAALFTFVTRILHQPRFDPARVNALLPARHAQAQPA